MRRSLIVILIFVMLFGIVRAQQTIERIAPGTYTGVITDTESVTRYQFEAVAGQQVRITMIASDERQLDAALSLFDSNGVLIQTDDDSAGNRDAQIDFVPQNTGIFTIEATRYQFSTPLTTGAYQLTLSITGNTPDSLDPLSLPPEFGVPFTELIIDEQANGTFTDVDALQYYVVGAQQGNFIRLAIESDPALTLNVRVLTRIEQTLSDLSLISRTDADADIIFFTAPQTGWYLIEIERSDGSGDYTLASRLVSDTLLSDTIATEAAFTDDAEERFFVFNATINERVFVNLTVTEGTNLEPELTILDLSQTLLDQRSSTGTQIRASIVAPRSGPFLVRVRNLNQRRGAFNIQLRRIPFDIDKLPIREASYNERYSGIINSNTPIDYFRFSGKAGELVTIEMNGIADPTTLDSYLILADSNLNELVFNDNVSASRGARIAQFALPENGDYFILATRAGLARGTTAGFYQLELTVGELIREQGILTATLTWQGEADLNLFARTPLGTTVSWANPTDPTGGILQIDSNTGCETPTAQPIEHIYWPQSTTLGAGDYIFWVWYQNTCMMSGETPFTLTVTYDGDIILQTDGTLPEFADLENGERFEASLRLNDNGNVAPLSRGSITRPTPQQTISQGGDELIVYGQSVSREISDQQFARFFQFRGAEGDNIIIQVERATNDLDPVLILRDEFDNNLQIFDDISTNNKNAQIIYTLPDNGRYIIAVTRYGVRDGTTTGFFNLSLSQLAAPDLEND